MSSGRCIAASSEIGENERVLGCVNQTLRRIAGSDGTLPLPERRARVLDLLGAIVLAMVGLRYASSDSMSVEKFEVVGPGRVVIDGLMASSASTRTVIAIGAAAMPLALRRRFPLGVLWVVMFSSALMRQQSPDVVFYACVLCSVAVYSAATYSPKRLATIITLPLAAAVLVALFKHASLPVLPHKYVALLVMIPLIVAAYGLRGWVHRVDEARDRLARSEALQWQALEHAVAAERARIARDLHDVVTHNVSMMVIQAGAARTVLDRSPEQAREALIAVESGGRAAVGAPARDGSVGSRCRRRGRSRPGGARATTRPAQRGRAGSVRARCRPADRAHRPRIGERAAVGGGPDGLRVVQEALTNAMKHASGSRVHVTIDRNPTDLSVSVVDTGGEPTGSAATGAGRGLIGLRERLAVYGGTLQSGPSLNGGFLVRAMIPTEAR
ncbi:MAG: hypothetical protein JWL72_2193 [Ilumatobacteraceae bacterium]|nr:hypothetical protein [Ilumatobacteraceae bacterium]